MKILFVCRTNTGRSQVSEAFYNRYSNSKDAQSAGTVVKDETQAVGDRSNADELIDEMNRRGIDISRNSRSQVTKEMLDIFDKVVVMTGLETVPEWLQSSGKYEHWDIEDIKDSDKKSAKKVVDILESRIKDLLDQ